MWHFAHFVHNTNWVNLTWYGWSDSLWLTDTLWHHRRLWYCWKRNRCFSLRKNSLRLKEKTSDHTTRSLVQLEKPSRPRVYYPMSWLSDLLRVIISHSVLIKNLIPRWSLPSFSIMVTTNVRENSSSPRQQDRSWYGASRVGHVQRVAFLGKKEEPVYIQSYIPLIFGSRFIDS